MNLRTKEAVERLSHLRQDKIYRELMNGDTTVAFDDEIGRASCRERV